MAVALLEAALVRLRLRRALFTLASGLCRPGAKSLESVRRMVALCLAQLPGVRESIGLGAPAAELDCLSGRASSRLLGSAPQRKIDLPCSRPSAARAPNETRP